VLPDKKKITYEKMLTGLENAFPELFLNTKVLLMDFIETKIH